MVKKLVGALFISLIAIGFMVGVALSQGNGDDNDDVDECSCAAKHCVAKEFTNPNGTVYYDCIWSHKNGRGEGDPCKNCTVEETADGMGCVSPCVECTVDTECDVTAGEECIAGECEVPECKDDTDCDEDEYCDPVNYECKKP